MSIVDISFISIGVGIIVTCVMTYIQWKLFGDYGFIFGSRKNVIILLLVGIILLISGVMRVS